MAKNTERFDLSDRLIHFFRSIDLNSPNAPNVPESFGFGNVTENTKWSALFMLRCAIRQRRLWATWAYRNNVRTIYGPNPAVCFTEMPLAAFLEAGTSRAARGEAMSQFALVFPKHTLFNKGANPVIYWLDDRNAYSPSGKGGEKRILNADLLPVREQYRYVTYNPTAERPIDWTHEREWRWPYRGDLSAIEKELEESGILSSSTDMPGLELYDSDMQDMGVIVRTEEQAKWVTHDILSLVDRGLLSKEHYRFILCSSNLPQDGKLRDPAEVEASIRNAIIDLGPYFQIDDNESADLNKTFSEMVQAVKNTVPEMEVRERGGAWLWILDNTHKLTRSLLDAGRIRVSSDRRYLVNLEEFDDIEDLRQREILIKRLSENVTTEFDIASDYFSVLDSDDPNEVPFYCGVKLNNRIFYNNSWD